MENNLLISELEDNFQKIHQKVNKDINSCELLYHYTDYEGLKGILKQINLRYTNYKYFNGPTEIKYGMEIVKGIIVKKYPEICNFYSFISMFFNEFDDNYSLYVACFSKKINKLVLWCYYANNSSGFAITKCS